MLNFVSYKAKHHSMKKLTNLLAAMLLLFLSTISNAQTISKLQEKLTLQMQDGGGSNGASVAWNANLKLYYACFAGNEEFPMAVFNKEGIITTEEPQEVGFDARGLWFDPKLKTIVGNSYNEGGWYQLNLEANGLSKSVTVIKPGLNQPDANSVGCYSTKDKLVYFLNGQTLRAYQSGKEKASKRVRLYFGKTENPKYTKSEDEDDALNQPDGYNSNAGVYTGIKNAEFGVLNIDNAQIELYSSKTGLLTQVLKLPKNTDIEASFNFAYANGYFWLFDKENRKWIGYK